MQYRSRAWVVLFVQLIASCVATAESKEAESKQTKITRALSAAPPQRRPRCQGRGHG
jgi:hypothetical protein